MNNVFAGAFFFVTHTVALQSPLVVLMPFFFFFSQTELLSVPYSDADKSMGSSRDADITGHMFLGGCHDFAIFLWQRRHFSKKPSNNKTRRTKSELGGMKKRKTKRMREERAVVITLEALVHQDRSNSIIFFYGRNGLVAPGTQIIQLLC